MLLVLPLGLGLLGFIEPCTVGSSLLFVKYLEGKQPAEKLLETGVFAITRAVFIGALGAMAALIGSAFLDLALSFPLVAVVFWGRARAALDRMAQAAERLPFWTGVVFVVLGIWSVYLGLNT